MRSPTIIATALLAAGCASYRETVVRDGKGTELRGEVVGGEEQCRRGNEHGLCRVRVAGGSILTMNAADVTDVRVEARSRSDTGHGGQFGVLASAGIAGGLTFSDTSAITFTTGWQMPVTGALTYGATDALELQLGYHGAPLGSSRVHYGTFGARYFLVPNDPIKYYTGASILVGTGVGLHTRAGYQLDFSRNVGMYIETGLTFTYEYVGTAGLTVFADAQLGLQVRFGE